MNIQNRKEYGMKKPTNNPINHPPHSLIILTKIIISKCLGFEACRWNGEMKSTPWLQELSFKVELIPVCPEVDIGLGVPRKPITLNQIESGIRVIQEETGIDLTEKLVTYSQGYLNYIGHVDGFILKSKSPSCGIDSTSIHYDDELLIGSGVFTSIAKKCFPNVVFVDEKYIEEKGVEAFIAELALKCARK
jgi:uncharacterized protein YbbK (DUF523 family)